jgi:imidazolonepropionase-like amidohydrolase
LPFIPFSFSEALGWADRTGSIDKGKYADLVAGDPPAADTAKRAYCRAQ